MLRFYRDTYPLVRRAMRLAGIDPASARAMRDIEEKLAAFVDTPELQRADAEADDAEEADGEPLLIDGMDPHEALNARLEATGRRYKESGTLPNLWFSSFMELLGWSTAYDDVDEADAGEKSLSALQGEREGPVAKRWEGEVGLVRSAGVPPACRRDAGLRRRARRPSRPAGALKERRRCPRRRPRPACCGSSPRWRSGTLRPGRARPGDRTPPCRSPR